MARKVGKAARIYERHFKGVPTFNTGDGGFSPLPWVLRRAQCLFKPREWQLLTYLMMRCGPESVCWQTDKEIAYDLDIGSKHIPAPIKSLVSMGFIRIAEAEGKRFICVVDPLTVIKNLVASGKFTTAQLTALNDDLEMMKLPPIEASASSLSIPLPSNVVTLRAATAPKVAANRR